MGVQTASEPEEGRDKDRWDGMANENLNVTEILKPVWWIPPEHTHHGKRTTLFGGRNGSQKLLKLDPEGPDKETFRRVSVAHGMKSTGPLKATDT